MEATLSTQERLLQVQIAQARTKLRGYEQDLKAADEELAGLNAQTQQFELLEQACGSLQKLAELGLSSSFWGDAALEDKAAERLNDVRGRVDAYRTELEHVQSRRKAILAVTAEAQETFEYLLDDLYYAQQEEERRKLEWVIEREPSLPPPRKQALAWARTGEDDDRFRKALLATILLTISIGALLPMIDLPLPVRGEFIEIPERLAQLVREERVRPAPPPPVREEPIEQKKPDEKAEQKPVEQPKTVREDTPQLASVQPQPEQAPQEKPEPVGILAFREQFSSLRQASLSPKLGREARLSSADDTTAARAERNMLTTNAPGSSGGINLAALSRNVGGGGGGGPMQGVQVTRASSAIDAIAPADRPLSTGPGPSRTDEEIQIVFDRYKAALYRLYNRELRNDPTLRGQMILRLTIEPDGTVSICELQSSDMNAPQLSAQVVDRVRTFNFGAKDVPAVTILYPIDFLPAA